MSRTVKFYKSINVKTAIMMLILFTAATLVASVVNYNHLRGIYEKDFTNRVLLSNSLAAAVAESGGIESYVGLMSARGDEFRQKQLRFYSDRRELLRLMSDGAPEAEREAVLGRLEDFREEMGAFKTGEYLRTLEGLRKLRDINKAKNVYILADTGLTDGDGTKLYTYIFDACDEAAYDGYERYGPGEAAEGEAAIDGIYETKQPPAEVLHDDNLYYSYSPIYGEDGEVIAVIGTDIGLEEMRGGILKSMAAFSLVFLLFAAIIISASYIMISRFVAKPLGGLTATAQKLAEGDVYTLVSREALKQETEIGVLARALNEMCSVYQSMLKSNEYLFSAASVGMLNVRNDASGYKGDIQKVIKQINSTLDATTLYLNSFPEAIFIMGKDFEMYFRNEQYVRRFGDISARQFVESVFPSGAEQAGESAEERFEKVLRPAGKNINAQIGDFWFSVMFKEIEINETADENSVFVVAVDVTDLMKERDNAQAAARAKGNFLSSMSHEMRTPMNAIIGMAKIADNTNDISKLKYCLRTIRTSSEHLLCIINDVLDMSKIESGKFELEKAPLNIERMLIKTCNIVIDSIEKKHQRFNVVMNKNLRHNYIGDEFRLSQVVTNMLSNAMKFTPIDGEITLTVGEVSKDGNTHTLRFSVADTGIGIKKTQIDGLFRPFEQADSGISRQYGGTGLGLAISKIIVEEMGGSIRVESEYGKGSDFIFEVRLERASYQDSVIFDGIHPSEIRLLIIESDEITRKHFAEITLGFGMTVNEASDADEAVRLIKSAHESGAEYDVIFLGGDADGKIRLDIIDGFDDSYENNTVIMVESLFEWSKMEKNVNRANISGCITKPLFPSNILNALNEALALSRKSVAIKSESKEMPDLSDVNVLLVEDVELNREIFISLLDETGMSIDVAENGIEAVAKFKENVDKYDIIIMDVEMPEMDGYEATVTLRALDIPKAKEIPIVAMTANVFKEDIEHCLACGMNDHLAKPIDERIVIEKILKYAAAKRP